MIYTDLEKMAITYKKNAETMLKDNVSESMKNGIWSKSYELKIKDDKNKKQIEKELSEINFINILKMTEKTISENTDGYEVLTLRKKENGEFTILPISLIGGNNGIHYNEKGEVISLYGMREYTFNAIRFRVIETWSNTGMSTMVTTGPVSKENVEFSTSSMSVFNSYLPKKDRLVEKWTYSNQFGGVAPAVLITNLELSTSLNDSWRISRGDGVRHINHFSELLGNWFLGYADEILNNRTQVVVASNDMNSSKKYSRYEGVKNVLRTSTGDNSSDISVIRGDISNTEWLNGGQGIIDMYRIACGLSPEYDSNNMSSSDTIVGTLLSKDKTKNTVDVKKTIREKQYTYLLKLIMMYYNYEHDEVKFIINASTLIDELGKMEYIQFGLANGLITKTKAIAMYNNIDTDDEDAINAIKNEAEAEVEQQDSVGGNDETMEVKNDRTRKRNKNA